MRKFTLKMLTLAVFVFSGLGVFAQTQFNATFNVDMTDAEGFDNATDEVYMSGSFAGWAQPGTDAAYKMEPTEAGSMIYTLTVTIDSGEVQYKYFRVINGEASWDNGEWTGDPNRMVYFTAETTYENVWANKPQSITFNVDVTDAEEFDPATEELFIAGSLANGWAQPGTLSPYMLTVTDDENIYSITLMLTPGDYQYKYFRVIGGEASWDYGEWTGDPNRDVTVDTVAATIDDIWGSPAGIFDNPATFSYSMYPNPVNDVLTLGNISGVSEIAIYDVSGKMIRRIDLQSTNEVSINVSELNSGMYIINVTDERGVATSKFVKN